MTDEQNPRGRKPQITVTPRTDEVDWDAALAERLDNPHGSIGFAFPLKNPELWDTYLASSEANPSRHYDMVHKKKWLPLTVDDLEPGTTAEMIGFNIAADGKTLCRGVRGQEVAFKQPKHIRNAIQTAKTEANKRGMGSAAKVKQAITTAAGNQLGSEAGDFLSRNVVVTGSDREGPLGA